MTNADMIKKLWDTMFGNGRKGVEERIGIISTQMKFILAMNTGIIGLLIKIIFFGGTK